MLWYRVLRSVCRYDILFLFPVVLRVPLSFPTRRSSDLKFFDMATTATLRMLPIVEPVLRAARPLMLMIRPQPWLIMYGATSRDRKSTRLNSSHVSISYAVFCLKKKKYTTHSLTQETSHN